MIEAEDVELFAKNLRELVASFIACRMRLAWATEEEVVALVRLVAPDWDVTSSGVAPDGTCSIYLLKDAVRIELVTTDVRSR